MFDGFRLTGFSNGFVSLSKDPRYGGKALTLRHQISKAGNHAETSVTYHEEDLKNLRDMIDDALKEF